MTIVPRNVEFAGRPPLSGWRKISLGSWRPRGDSSVYGTIEVEVGPAVRALGGAVSLNVFLARAVAHRRPQPGDDLLHVDLADV